jgi:hypothetical protein
LERQASKDLVVLQVFKAHKGLLDLKVFKANKAFKVYKALLV